MEDAVEDGHDDGENEVKWRMLVEMNQEMKEWDEIRWRMLLQRC